jgi:WD40 repeat protein
VLALVVSPDGRFVFSGSQDGLIKQWTTASGTLLRTLTPRCAFVHCLAVSPDGRDLFSGHGNTVVNKWDVASGTVRARAPLALGAARC